MGGGSTRWMVTEEQVAQLRLLLIRNATMFDDPGTYQAGIEDALTAVLDLSQCGEVRAADATSEPRPHTP